jgi:hypothetical protein
MNRFVLPAAILAGAIIFSRAAQAMEIRQFDKMAEHGQDEYVADLILGAQKILKDSGKADLAEKVHRLFTEKDPQANVATGMIQLDLSIAKARVADLERIGKDSNAVRLEVEHAMIVVLKQSGITMPPAFMHVADSFKPKLPPKK